MTVRDDKPVLKKCDSELSSDTNVLRCTVTFTRYSSRFEFIKLITMTLGSIFLFFFHSPTEYNLRRTSRKFFEQFVRNSIFPHRMPEKNRKSPICFEHFSALRKA